MTLVVAELVRRHPAAAQILRDEGLASCLGCAMSPFETVAEAARELRLDPSRIERALQPLASPVARARRRSAR